MEKAITSPAYRALIMWLQSCRKQRGLTLRDLGHELDVSHTWVAKVESLERRLDVLEYVRVCESLGLDPVVGLERLQQQQLLDSFSSQKITS